MKYFRVKIKILLLKKKIILLKLMVFSKGVHDRRQLAHSR